MYVPPPKKPKPAPAAVVAPPAPPPRPARETALSRPTFPSDFGEWTVADFLSARAAGEPRLVAAITHRVEKPLHNFEEAAMLATLLSFPAAGPNNATNQQAELTRAIVAALEANGTPMGQANLAALVDGNLLAGDEQTAVDAALAALVRLAHTDTDEMVARAILAPQDLRPPGRGKVTADGLWKAAIAAVHTGGSSRLRLHLAAAAIDPQQPAELRGLLQGLLCEPAAENLEAMAVLYGSPVIDMATRAALETYLATNSSQFIWRLLRIPEALSASDKAARAAGAPVPAAMKFSSHLPTLWNAGLASAVNRQLEQLESLPSQPRLILLAATIPTDSVRPVLYEALRRNWEDGPQSLTNIPLAPQSCWEPGLLVSMKLLRPSHADPPPRVPTKVYKPKKSRRVTRKPPPVKEEDRLRREWLLMEQSLITGLCQRFHLAAQVQETSAQNSPSPRGDGHHDNEPPIPLHEGARVVNYFGLRWPEDLPADVPAGNVGTTEIKYVRIQQTSTHLKAIVNHYRNQLESPIEHVLQNGLALWLESHKLVPDSGRCRSVDVVITRAKVPQSPNEEEKIAIDILLVEVNDPSHPQ
jgi:hypothetical protein